MQKRMRILWDLIIGLQENQQGCVYAFL